MSAEEWKVKQVMDSCAFKTTLSCVAGAGFGVVFGLFTAAVDPNITGTETPTTKLVLQGRLQRVRYMTVGTTFPTKLERAL